MSISNQARRTPGRTTYILKEGYHRNGEIAWRTVDTGTDITPLKRAARRLGFARIDALTRVIEYRNGSKWPPAG